MAIVGVYWYFIVVWVYVSMFITKCFFFPPEESFCHSCSEPIVMAVKKVSSQSEWASMVQGPRETGKRQGRCSLEKQSGRGGTLPRHQKKGVGQRRWRGSGVRSAWVRVGSMKNREPLLLSCLPRCGDCVLRSKETPPLHVASVRILLQRGDKPLKQLPG